MLITSQIQFHVILPFSQLKLIMNYKGSIRFDSTIRSNLDGTEFRFITVYISTFNKHVKTFHELTRKNDYWMALKMFRLLIIFRIMIMST